MLKPALIAALLIAVAGCTDPAPTPAQDSPVSDASDGGEQPAEVTP